MKIVFFQIRYFSIVLFTLGITPGSPAQQWTTNGPYGGRLSDVIVSGSNLFVGTGYNGVFRSTNNGASWVPANSGLPSDFISGLVSTSNSDLFVAMGNNGVYRSSDNGTSWTLVNSGLPGRFVRSLTTNGNILWVNASSDGNSGGVYISVNNGSSWTLVNVNSGLPNQHLNAVATIGTNLFAATAGSGVYRSVDNGTTWTSVNTGLSNLSVSTLAVIGTNLFAGTIGGGVFLSTNNGASWAGVNSGLTNVLVTQLGTNGTNLFCATSTGVFLSTNNGSSWSAVNTGLPQTSISALASVGSSVFAATDKGFFLTSNNGSSWSASNTGLNGIPAYSSITVGSNVFVGTDDGVYRSTDNGNSWVPASSGLVNQGVWAFAATGASLFCGALGVFVSTNNGDSWTAANSGLPNQTVRDLAVIGTNIFAAIDGSGVFLSTNNGSSWSAVNSGLSNLSVQSLAVSGSSLFAGTLGGGVFFSSNNGASWTPVNSGLPNLFVTSLFVSGQNLFAGTQQGIFVSSNNGASWATSITSVSNVYGWALGNLGVFAGTFFDGRIFFSNDNGITWTTVNSNGLGSGFIHSLSISGQNLFAATQGGVFVRSLPSISSVNPTSGGAGTSVTVSGANFSTTATNNTVTFNGVNAVVSASTTTSLTVTVPANATTGPIAVTVSGVTATSASNFSVTSPAITSFSPTSGGAGTSVTISGANFSTTPANNTVTFNGVTAAVTASSATSLTVAVPANATSGPIAVRVGGVTANSASNFSVTSPAITSFSPTSGGAGTSVTISGANFSTTPANNTVTFNGVTAAVTVSSATSLTVAVPTNATTGPIAVTVGGVTANSASNFSVTSPAMTSFSPTSGGAGTSVTISGANFSATPANNIVTFNGVAANVTSSSSLSLITTVPSNTSSGPIVVTVDGVSATSGTSFTILDSSPPVINDNTAATTDFANTASAVISAGVIDNESAVTSVVLQWRSISAGGTLIEVPLQRLGSTYSTTISFDPTDLPDLGIEYRITATSTGGTATTGAQLKTVRVQSPATGLTIPYTSFGSGISSYRIVSVPLVLGNASLGNVFEELGTPNRENWRLLRYENGVTSDLSTTSIPISPGLGYWLIVRADRGALQTGPGTTVQTSSDAPFEIDLRTGWNQIGNPYNFNLAWADVQAANPGLPGLRGYNGSFGDATQLDRMGGGFVRVNSTQKLRFPVVRNPAVNGGRSVPTRQPNENPLTAENWLVKFFINNRVQTNTISGFGMAADASESFDPLDGLNMPAFFDSYLELRHHKQEGPDSYSMDIVPTKDHHVWSFEVVASHDREPVSLSWDNRFFGDNEKQLFLWDVQLQRAINMRAVRQYVIHPGQSGTFKVVFGSDTFVKQETSVVEPVLHPVWPNPAHDQARVAFTLPDSGRAHEVEIQIIDAAGRICNRQTGQFWSGYHEVEVSRSALFTSGVYIVQMQTGGTRKQTRLVWR